MAEREIRLLKQELESARLEAHIGNYSVPQTSEMKWKDIKEMTGDYDGNSYNFDSWVKQTRKLVDTYRLTEQTAKFMICHTLKGSHNDDIIRGCYCTTLSLPEEMRCQKNAPPRRKTAISTVSLTKKDSKLMEMKELKAAMIDVRKVRCGN